MASQFHLFELLLLAEESRVLWCGKPWFFINFVSHNEFARSSNTRTPKQHVNELPTAQRPPPPPHNSRYAHAQPSRRVRTFRRNIFPRILRRFGSDLKRRFRSDLRQCAQSGSNVCFRFLSDISFPIWHVVSDTVCAKLNPLTANWRLLQ